MGNKNSKGKGRPKGLDLGKAAYLKRAKRCQDRFVENDEAERVENKNLLEQVASDAANSIETQNEIKEHSRLTVMGAILGAIKQGVSSNPVWQLWNQIQRSKALESEKQASKKMADFGSDVLVTGGTCISLWMAKKVSIVYAPALWVINGADSHCGFGSKLFLMGEFGTKGHKYFGIGIKERYAFYFGCVIAVALYYVLWKLIKWVIRTIKKIFALI